MLRLRSAGAGHHVSYLDFLPRFYEVRLEPAQFPFLLQGEHFETGHLWFVVLLLTFSLLLAPLVRWLPHAPVRRIGDRLAHTVLHRPGTVLAPALVFAAICAFARMEQEYAGWHRWSYLLFFLAGFTFAADDRFRAVMRREARLAAVLGVALFAASGPGFALADDWLGAWPPPSPADPRCPALDDDPEGCACLELTTRGLTRFGLPELRMTAVACRHGLAALNVLRTTAQRLLPLGRTPGRHIIPRQMPLTGADFGAYWGTDEVMWHGDPLLVQLTRIRPDLLRVGPPADWPGSQNDWLWDELPPVMYDLCSYPPDSATAA